MIIAIIVLVTTSLIHIFLEVKDYYMEVNYLKTEYLETKKEQFQYNVNNGIAIINTKIEQYEKHHSDLEKVQTHTLSLLENLQLPDNEYIFVGTYDGTVLLGPQKNNNVFNYQDKNGKKFVQEIIKIAQASGGYIDYIMPELENHKSGKKISYVKGIDEWGWFIGSGNYVDKIESMIIEKRNEVLVHVLYNMLIMLLATLLLFLYYISYQKKYRNLFLNRWQNLLIFLKKRNTKTIKLIYQELNLKNLNKLEN